MCQDCIKFLTDAQAEAKQNSSFVDSLIENIENQCDLLGPALSSMVRTPQEGRSFNAYFSLKCKKEIKSVYINRLKKQTMLFLTAVQGICQRVWHRRCSAAHVHGECCNPPTSHASLIFFSFFFKEVQENLFLLLCIFKAHYNIIGHCILIFNNELNELVIKTNESVIICMF